MPSGKQLSFAYGEVSPALRFKADAVSYPEGLFQLTNGYVKKGRTAFATNIFSERSTPWSMRKSSSF